MTSTSTPNEVPAAPETEAEIRQRIAEEVKQLEQQRIKDNPDPTLFAAGVVNGLGMARAIIERGAATKGEQG